MAGCTYNFMVQTREHDFLCNSFGFRGHASFGQKALLGSRQTQRVQREQYACDIVRRGLTRRCVPAGGGGSVQYAVFTRSWSAELSLSRSSVAIVVVFCPRRPWLWSSHLGLARPRDPVLVNATMRTCQGVWAVAAYSFVLARMGLSFGWAVHLAATFPTPHVVPRLIVSLIYLFIDGSWDCEGTCGVDGYVVD